jgi:hypothetical protein
MKTYKLLASVRDQPSDLRLSAKLLPTFADRGCCVASTTDPYGRILMKCKNLMRKYKCLPLHVSATASHYQKLWPTL